MSDFDAVVSGIMAATGVGRVRAIQVAQENGFRPLVHVSPVDEAALEKVTEHEGDKLMIAFGFRAIRFSQPRASKQTPGIADRRYYRRPRVVERADGRFIVRAFALWWEAKSATGEQSADERVFQEDVEACGEEYLLGTHEVLARWLVDVGLARRADERGDHLEPVDCVPLDAPRAGSVA